MQSALQLVVQDGTAADKVNSQHKFDHNKSKRTSSTSAMIECMIPPLLPRSRRKHGQHRSKKRGRSHDAKQKLLPGDVSADRGNNRPVHLSHKNRATHDHIADAEVVAKHPFGLENMLPQLVANPAIPSPQKLRHLRRTWNTTLKPQAGICHSENGLQQRALSPDSMLATFQTTETILVAEIDSDERCTSFLRQRASRETLFTHPDWGSRDTSQSQIQYKLRALDRKIQMNKEKLAQVQERIVVLGGKPNCLATLVVKLQEIGPEKTREGNPELVDAKNASATSEPNQWPTTKKLKKPPVKRSIRSAATAALAIQCSFRAFRARRCLADLLTKIFHRVLHPESNQYFYYNRLTKLSQWEPPMLLRHCSWPFDVMPNTTAAETKHIDPASDAAARTIQTMVRQRLLRLFLQDLKLGNLEKVFDAGFGAWYYFNARTNHSFWENVHHVRLTASTSSIYHRSCHSS